MAEFRKEIGVDVTIALVVALGVGLIAVTAFPNGLGTTTSPGFNPVPLAGLLFSQNVSCALATGTCTMTIVNNSTTPLELESCRIQVIVGSNGTSTTWRLENGTLGGPAVKGIAADSGVIGTCTVPTSELSNQTAGSFANGGFTVRLVDNWYSVRAGAETGFGFEGTWS